jgi:hypothetical protein
MNEFAYQNKLLAHLKNIFKGDIIWIKKGRTIPCTTGFLRPDIEIESFVDRGVETIAVIELKWGQMGFLSQPFSYAIVMDIPFYGLVDGSRRSPLKWHHNPLCTPKQWHSSIKLKRQLVKIKYAIEDYNFYKISKEN